VTRRHPALLLSLVAALACVAGVSAPAHAFDWAKIAGSTVDLSKISLTPIALTWKCVKGSGGSCTNADLANPSTRHIVLLPGGFTEEERDAFWSEFDRTVALMTGPEAKTAWSAQKKSQLIFVGYFVAGGPVNAPDAAFKARIPQHPIRGYATSLDQESVYQKINEIRATTFSNLAPMAAGVIFNSYQEGTTANASPPGFIGKPYGIGKWTRRDLDERGPYLPVHELAHAGLSFYDEYRERGFEELNIRSMDVLTPLVLFDWTWGGFIRAISDLLSVYDYNLSEILADSGSENIILSPWRATVATPGQTNDYYRYEGGMFFGRGTYHVEGNNVMNGSNAPRGPNDGFDFAHTGPQQRVVNTAFDGVIRRANDRIRNAGPKSGWKLAMGSETHVMLFDADKNHHWHPTKTYTVQVGWYERNWKVCWAAFIPYPCYDDVWTTAETTVPAAARSLDLKLSFAYGLLTTTQNVLCAVGVNEIPANGQTYKICEQDLNTIAANFLPTVKFPLPYQDVTVPASQWMTTYWWRFKTDNGGIASAFTGWSSFFRSF
jgi:hypothetical protein